MKINSYLTVKAVELLCSLFIICVVDGLTQPGSTAMSKRWKQRVWKFTKLVFNFSKAKLNM